MAKGDLHKVRYPRIQSGPNMKKLKHRISQRRRILQCPYSEGLSSLVSRYKLVDGVSEDELARAIGYGDPLNPEQLESVAKCFGWTPEQRTMMRKLTDDRRNSIQGKKEELLQRQPTKVSLEQSRKPDQVEQPSLRDIRDQREELDAHCSFFGRNRILQRVDEFVSDLNSGNGRYLLLLARPFFGKSAVAAQLVRRLPKLAGYHFIKRGQGDWDSPDVILRSLAAQIRRRYNLSEPDSDQNHTPPALLQDAFLRASRSLPAGENIVVLIDGLDEAFGLLGRATSDGLARLPFPIPPPPRCKMIVTSREGKHVEQLFDAAYCDMVRLEEFIEENDLELRDWISNEIKVSDLELDDKFIQQLVKATHGLFGAAVRLLREREGRSDRLVHWRDHPEDIPRGLDGLLKWEWERLVSGAQRKGVSEPECRRLLGLLAFAREPLDFSTLQALLLEMIRYDPTTPFSIPGIEDALTVMHPADLLKNGEFILNAAREYFTTENCEQTGRPFRFFHSAFGEFIKGIIVEGAEDNFCEQILAQGCAVWRNPRLRKYATRHRFEHLLSLEIWCVPVGLAFADTEFIETCLAEIPWHILPHTAWWAKCRSAGSPDVKVQEWATDFDGWECFISARSTLLKLFPQSYAQEVVNEFIHSDYSPVQPTAKKLRSLFAVIESSALSSRPFSLRKLHGPTTLDGHYSRRVSLVAFAPDTKRYATSNRDGVVIVWDLRTDKAIARTMEDSNVICSLAFSRDGTLVCGGTVNGTVKVWDACTGTLVTCGAGHASAVGGVAFSPDAKLVASGSEDGTIRVWDASAAPMLGVWRTPIVRRRAKSQNRLVAVGSLAFAPDGARLAVGDLAGRITIWDAAVGAKLFDNFRDSGGVRSVDFSPEGTCLVCGDANGKATFWKMCDGDLSAVASRGSLFAVNSVAFSPKGPEIAIGFSQKIVIVWNPQIEASSALFFPSSIKAVSFAKSDPPELFVANEFGQIWSYALRQRTDAESPIEAATKHKTEATCSPITSARAPERGNEKPKSNRRTS